MPGRKLKLGHYTNWVMSKIAALGSTTQRVTQSLTRIHVIIVPGLMSVKENRGEDITMRSISRSLNQLLAMGLVLATFTGAGSALAQSKQSGFDPTNPFANITFAEQWAKKFNPGKPDIEPNDPFGNMTSAEFWRDSWEGQNIDHPYRSPASIKGSGGTGVIIRSPYPYKTAKEQYEAWLKAAHGGTKHARGTLPDWSGDWQGSSTGVLSGYAKVSDVMAAVAPAYRRRFVTLLRGEWEGGHQWWPTEYCLPYGFGGYYAAPGNAGATWHFMMDEHMVIFNKDKNNMATRYIYTDGRGFLPPNRAFPQWYGESKGFWDGDQLVIYTKNIRQWAMTHGLPEFSSQIQTVERVKRFPDGLLVDITLYDPKAFAFPWHDVVLFKTLKDWTTAPATYSECVSTNNIYMDAKGVLQERVPGDVGYRNPSDRRPWATAYKLWNSAHPKEAARWKAIFARAIAGAETHTK